MNFMWQDLRWLGKYDFKIYRLAIAGEPITNWPAEAGVYMFVRFELVPTNLPNYGVLYVGETGNLLHRMADHEKKAYALSMGWNQLHFHSNPNEDRRKAIERELISHFNPPLNDQVILPWS